MAASSDNIILVTGGAGYIGSQTCKRLAAEGYTPVCFDNLKLGHREFVRWGPLEEGDLADADRIAAAIERHRPAAVIHFAALANVGESMAEPARYYRNNVFGTLNLLEAMRAHGVGRIVFSSTCATYGQPQGSPLTEDHPQNPINPYGSTKLAVERMLADYEAAHGFRSACLRYFNAAGADPEAEIGEDHDPETHLIPLALDVALGRREELHIFGDDYDTPDGTCVRDYIHVADLADAHLRALRRLAAGGESMRLNLGNGQGYSVREVVEAAGRVTGRPIAARVTERRPGDPPRLVGDAAKAREMLEWSPQFASLDVIIEHAWNWHRKRFGSS